MSACLNRFERFNSRFARRILRNDENDHAHVLVNAFDLERCRQWIKVTKFAMGVGCTEGWHCNCNADTNAGGARGHPIVRRALRAACPANIGYRIVISLLKRSCQSRSPHSSSPDGALGGLAAAEGISFSNLLSSTGSQKRFLHARSIW